MSLETYIKELEELSQKYYDTGDSGKSDAYFDNLLEKVRELDPTHPILTKVAHGYELKGIDEKERFKHPIEVGSIPKTKSLEELKEFLDETSTQSTKIDGNSIVAYYQNGNLQEIVTRGSENIGIIRTAKFISKIRKNIPVSRAVAVRGEAAIRKDKYLSTNGFDTAKSSRNAVAGAISRKDDWEGVFDHVDFIAYTFIDIETGDDLYNVYPWAEWFNVEEQRPVDYTIFTDILKFKKMYKDDYSYDADGMVFKTGNKYLAFKFDDETGKTSLKNVVWKIGKDQRLTPVGILEPIKLAGATIEKASLGSYSNAVEKGCWPVSKTHIVEVIRANEIIPYITKTLEKSLECDYGDFPTCPVCGSKSVPNGEHVFCVNPECENLDSSKLFNFSSNFYPEGLSDKIVEKFFESEEIYNVFDLLNYSGNFEKSVFGIGESHMEKINKFLENTRKSIDVKILYDSFLKSCGDRASQKIVDFGFDIFQWFFNPSTITVLDDIPNFNSNIKKDLMEKRELFKRVCDIRTITQEKSKSTVGSFCITGARFSKEQLNTILELGWKEDSSIKKTTTYLVTKDPESTSSKIQKAKDYGIKVLTIDQFMEYINI
jgi:DNA ligase (NAD+)